MLAPGIGGVEEILGEFGGEARQFPVDGLEAALLVRGQIDAGEVEVAQRIGQQLALGGVQVLLGGDSAIAFEQGPVLADLGGVVAELGQASIVGGAQGLAVHDGVEMADG